MKNYIIVEGKLRIHFLVHADIDQQGIIETWANIHGFQTKYSRPYAGDPIPTPDQFDWLVITGGPQSLLEIDHHPYLTSEIDLIKQACSSEKTVLGFCLGAQLIGEALDAKTEQSPFKEMGIFPIQLTEEGLRDHALRDLDYAFPVMHWHYDMPGLTKEARILAMSEGCPRQIVRYSHFVYGFQCHIEPTLQDIRCMIKSSEDTEESGPYVQPIKDILSTDFSAINQILYQILENLLDKKDTIA